jgi:hypothetical protein
MSRKKFIGIRVTAEEDSKLRFESQRQERSIANLIREGFLLEMKHDREEK